MSDYFLADERATERANQRAATTEPQRAQVQQIKTTLLGEFLMPSGEPQGCDPYNSTQGKVVRDAWQSRRHRR
jgi:hypothetical protein